MADFEAQGIYLGEEMRRLEATNTEAGGALVAVAGGDAEPVPLLRAFAVPSGRLTREARRALEDLLAQQLRAAGALDGLVLALHGALAGVGRDSVDEGFVRLARSVLGTSAPIGVCLDLHANVVSGLIDQATFVIGYHTNPHVDQAATGARTAQLVLDAVRGTRRPSSVLAKRPMLIPAQSHGMAAPPMSHLRQLADERSTSSILDVSLFPVQPWLDVRQLGFGVVVTADDDPSRAHEVAEELAERAWELRRSFAVDLVDPLEAMERVRNEGIHPRVLADSSDAPTAGAPGDSPAVLAALLSHGRDLRAYIAIVDPAAVAACHSAGVGAPVTVEIGASIERRFHAPVELSARVSKLGENPIVLTGPVLTGTEVNIGRWAVLQRELLSVLVTERPAWEADPATFEQVGLPLADADVVVVRSCFLFTVGYGKAGAHALQLDLPGSSTPRLDRLVFRRAPRPLYPLDGAV
jgi:microcystin degradation protein MlrC